MTSLELSNFWRGFKKTAEKLPEKKKYQSIPISELDPKDKSQIWTAKIDGSMTFIDMRHGKLPRLFSHRISKRTGNPIEYTPKLPHIQQKSPFDALVRAETYAIDKDGKAVKPEVVAALLNRTVDNSLYLQKQEGLKTRTALIDVDKYKGRDVSNASFAEKHQILQEITKKYKAFHLPDYAVNPSEKKTLLEKILSKSHPQTQEGVVVHKLDEPGGHFLKAKVVDEMDVHVVDIFKEEGVKPGCLPMAGGIVYSWDSGGKPVGKIGTGFNHATKKDMLENPNEYIGRVARVKALDLSKNKVLVKPSFSMWHVEKNISDN